jgi:hypothetical protein
MLPSSSHLQTNTCLVANNATATRKPCHGPTYTGIIQGDNIDSNEKSMKNGLDHHSVPLDTLCSKLSGASSAAGFKLSL